MNKGLKNKILELHSQGKSYNDIAKELVCSKGTVSFHCKKAGKGKEYLKPDAKQIESIKNRYVVLKQSIKRIASDLNFSVYVVKKVTKELEREIIGKSNKVVNWRKRTKKKLVEHFGGKCTICGYDKYEGALEFHHKDPSQKDFTLSGKSFSFDRMLEEAKKCVLVCSNCHSEIHGGIINL